MENLVQCSKCGGDACLKGVSLDNTTQKDVDTYFCFGCGFTTTSVSKANSEMIKNALESAPELYKDLMFVDDSGLAWLPATVTLPKVGMVFLDGTNTVDWQWGAVKAILLEEEEKSKYPEGQTHKMNMKEVKYFGKRDFMDALDEIGFFQVG